MKKIKVEIVGETPLLMNSPQAMIEQAMGSNLTKVTKKRDMVKDAEKLAYKTSKGELYIPAEAIKGSMVNASAYKKAGKYALRPFIAGAVMIKPTQIGLGTKIYELDIRTVVIQKARVVKARPMLENWKASFEIWYNEELLNDPDTIRVCLEEAGGRVGILDFRPQKLGNFGMFKVTKWQEEK